MTKNLYKWLPLLLLTCALVTGYVLVFGTSLEASHNTFKANSVEYPDAPDGGNITFSRYLSGDRVGQHKVPPLNVITIQISVTTGNDLSTTTLVDYFPASWLVVDVLDGQISTVGGNTSRIEWQEGDVASGTTITREYILLSPQRTIPPTTYNFTTELLYAGGSVLSAAWDVVVADPPPAEPSDPYAKALTSSSIAVAWVPSRTSDIDGYKIYRSGNGTDYSLSTTLSGGQLVSSYVDIGLPASATFYYKISSWRGTEESFQTSATNTITLPPDPPRGLRASGGNSTITLTWNTNSAPNLSGYNIYRATTSNGTFGKINPALVTTTSYIDSGPLIGGAFYFYRVTAVDSTGAEGEMSPEVWDRPYYNPTSGGPHMAYSSTPDTCALCHRTHYGQSPGLLPATTQKDLCFTCHDGSGSQYFIAQEFVAPVSQHPLPDETLKCSDCHDPHFNWQDYPKLLSTDNIHLGNEVCYTCHGGADPNPPTVDYQTPFETGFHKPYIANSRTGTQIQCTSCHKPHASYFRSLQIQKDENGCFYCHDTSTIGADVFSNFIASSDADAHHDIFDTDQTARTTSVECVNCHNPHTIASTSGIINPNNPSPDSSSIWSDTVTAFCLVCHDDALPNTSQTEPFAPVPRGPTPALIDINEAFYPGTDGRADEHGSQGLVCSTCHDTHGTTNPFHLNTTVYSANQATLKEGLLVIKIADGQYDFRYFCNACHDEGNHGNSKSFPSDCTAGNCHLHGQRF